MLTKIIESYRLSRNEFTDTFYLVLLQGVNQFLPLLVMPYLMITLGADKYGYIGFAQSVIQYFILITDFGFNLSATKRIAMVKDNIRAVSVIFYSTLYAKLFLLVCSTVLFIVLSLTIEVFKVYNTALWFTYPTVIGSVFTFFWMFQGVGKVRNIAVINTLSKILVLPLIFFFIKKPEDYKLAALIQSMVYVLTALISCYYLFKWKVVQRTGILFSNIKLELKEGFPLFLSAASTSIYTQLFVVILGFMATPAIVGKYAAAERIMRAMCFVFYTPINQAFYPKISSLSVTNNKLAKKLLKNVFFLVCGVMGMISLFLFFGGGLIADFLGKEYEGIHLLLRIFSLVPIAIGCGGILGQMGLIALGNYHTKVQFQNVYFIVAPISLILVTCLTPLYMENGAAWSLVTTEYLVFYLMFYYYKKARTC